MSKSDHQLTPLEGGWGYMVALATFLCAFLMDGLGEAYGVLMPEIRGQFQVPMYLVTLPGGLLVGISLAIGEFRED